MNDAAGYVKIWRALLDHPVFRDDAERVAWLRLICQAAWKPRRIRYKDRELHFERGQLAFSERDFAQKMGWSRARVRRFLEKLKNRSMIRPSSAQQLRIITICNYDQYQEKRFGSGPATGPEAAQVRPTEQEGEESKNLRKKDLSSKRGSDAIDSMFDSWWSDCPKKIGKGQARRAFKAALRKVDVVHPDELDYVGYVERERAAGQDDRYIKHPATWLNGECWNDEQEPATGDQQSSGKFDIDLDEVLRESGLVSNVGAKVVPMR